MNTSTAEHPVAGTEINRLDCIVFVESDGGYLARINAAGVAMTIPAHSLDSYSAARRELLRRHAVRLVLWGIEEARQACDARREWLDAVSEAIERGRGV